jgi:P4 family phage/plasmid primase-like protien
MDDDREKIAYLQRICGLCLTADTSLECLWFLYGASTRNGKSTFVETMAQMLGDYALSTPPETPSQRRRQAGAASGDLARLDGCRFLNASEPPKRMLLDTALVKTLTGRDSITARNLYEREFQFRPKFKLLINTNNLPVISDDTLFTSDRVRVIEFPHHFTEAEQKPQLKRELCLPENLSGLLNWCIEGLCEYRRIGEKPPESVRTATASYQKDSDKISLFFSEVMEKNAEFNVAGSTVYERYSKWCEDSGFGVDSKSSFFSELRSRGFLAESATVNGKSIHNAIRGYRIKPIWK